MVPSTSKPLRRPRTKVVVLIVLCSILLWDSSAYAINAFVSQDLPILTEMAATELASYGELGSILAEAAAITAQVKEYTTIAKTAWGALDELRHLSWEDLGGAAKDGLSNAFPELQQMYGDVRDIRDLDYRDERAAQTIRGALWEEAYGPAIDYLHSGHEDLDAIAGMSEHRGRASMKISARRTEAEQWEEDCKRTSQDGNEGACQAAANRAAIQSALMLQDVNETALYQLQGQERLIAAQDRRELDRLYEYDRFVFDMRNYFLAVGGVETECTAGQCLHERYGDSMWREVQRFRARHPQRYEQRIVMTLPERNGEP